MRFETPKEDIERSLEIERSVEEHELALYLECMSGVPMSQRVQNPRELDAEGRDVRDGCILTGVFCRCRSKK